MSVRHEADERWGLTLALLLSALAAACLVLGLVSCGASGKRVLRSTRIEFGMGDGRLGGGDRRDLDVDSSWVALSFAPLESIEPDPVQVVMVYDPRRTPEAACKLQPELDNAAPRLWERAGKEVDPQDASGAAQGELVPGGATGSPALNPEPPPKPKPQKAPVSVLEGLFVLLFGFAAGAVAGAFNHTWILKAVGAVWSLAGRALSALKTKKGRK